MFTSNMVLTIALAGIALSANAVQVNNFSPAANKVIIVKFFGPTCPPCKAFAPIYNQVAHSFAHRNDVSFFEINAQMNTGIAKRWGATNWPTTLVFKNGSLVSRLGRGSSALALTQAINNALA
jgi:thiol-disulfide isomerase/thioredoxin